MCEQNVSYLVKDLELEAKKLNRICHKNCSKSSKMAITVSKFLKTFRVSIPPDPLKPYFCSSICFKLTSRKKIRLKNVKILCHPPPPSEYSEYAPDVKHFQRAYALFRFRRLTSLHSFNIQPNSKLHPPLKFSGSAPGYN